MNEKSLIPDPVNTNHISEIHGHEKALNFLKERINKERVPHAVIISGKKGIGKSKIAKSIARYLLLNTNKKMENNDFFKNEINNIFICQKEEIEKEKKNKNILIADIRKLKGFFELTSPDNNWRISIIDSIDDLTVSALNALLKLTEEPPEKSLFLLICHNLSAIKPTLKSRCQILKCNPLNNENINLILGKNVPKYNELSDEEKKIILALSNGSPGKASKYIKLDFAKYYSQIIDSFSSLNLFSRDKINQIIFEISKGKIKKESFFLIKQIILVFVYRLTLFIFKNNITFINQKEKEFFISIKNKKFNTLRLAKLYTKLERKFENASKLNLDDEQTLITTLIDIEKTINDEKLYYR